MKTYQVLLTKSYMVTVEAKGDSDARLAAELYTGDIQDISTHKDRIKTGFSIREIECRMNEGTGVVEIKS